MLTWLDYYVDGYAESLGRMLAAMGMDARADCRRLFGKRLAEMGDIEAFRTAMLLQAASVRSPAAYQADVRGGNLAVFSQFLLPFAVGGQPLRGLPTDLDLGTPAMFRTVAVQPSADLVAALSRARPPAGQDETVRRELLSATWYVDLPRGALRVGGLDVRALFAQPSPTLGTVAVCAVLTPPGSDRMAGRLMWLLGDRSGDVQGIGADVDRRLLQDEVDGLVSLLVLYRLHAERAQRGALPKMTREQVGSRKARQHHKRASLFSVESLAPPADRFGRARREGEAGGWSLGWRSEVSGHFRLQPHGPERALRRLIYVESYERGPADAPRKVALERLATIGGDVGGAA